MTALEVPELEVDVRLPLDRFDLDVRFAARKTVTGIFGPSGSGKTTLLEAIAGLRRGVQGKIRIDGAVWLDAERRQDLPPEKRAVGYVPQDGLLFPHLDVRQNLLAGSARARRSGQDPEKSLAQAADLLELVPLLERDVQSLSGGERQRVALGRALCSAPRLLLLDEPLAALDLPLRRRLLPMLRRVRSELRVPMLFVSHDPIEIQALCDEVLVLNAGALIAQGPPRNVLTDPDAFPLAGHQGYENIFPATFLERRQSTSVLRLGPGLEWIAGRCAAVPGDELLVGLPANEILLATEAPRGLSARNVLPVEVKSIRPFEDHSLVEATWSPDLPSLFIEVLPTTPERLGLEAGSQAYAILKATSCRLYAHRSKAAED